jgi:hypothetical protein
MIVLALVSKMFLDRADHGREGSSPSCELLFARSR